MFKILNILLSSISIYIGVSIIQTKIFRHNGLVIQFSEPWQYWGGGFLFFIFGASILYKTFNLNN